MQKSTRRLYPFALALLIGLFTLQSCISFGSKEEESAEETEESTSSRSESDRESDREETNSNNPMTQLQNMADQMEDMAKQMEEGGTVEMVNFRELKALLPEKLSGMERTNSSGETGGAMGFSISKAEGRYEDGDKQIDVEIIDVGGMSMALMGMAAWAMAEYDRETDDGYERTTTFDGHKAYEKYDSRSQRAEKGVIVANRIIVTAKGRNVNMEDLDDLLDEIDIDDVEDLIKK